MSNKEATEEIELTISQRIAGIIWRSVLVGSAYTLTTFGLGNILIQYGIPFPDMTKLGISKPWFLVASLIMGFVIGAISQIIHTSKANHMLTWTILLFLNPFAVTLESAVLAPELLNPVSIPGLMLVQFIAALVTSLLITLLFASSSKQNFGSYIHRPWAVWTMRFAICVGIALLICALLGATNYRLISKLYYNNYKISIPLPSVEVIFAIQFMKALLTVLSLIPMVITVGATKRFIAVMSGLTLVVLGALSPFLQMSDLSMYLLLASSGKFFLQYFCIGILVGLVLGNPSRLEVEGISTVAFLRPILREALKNNAEFFKGCFTSLRLKKPSLEIKKEADQGGDLGKGIEEASPKVNLKEETKSQTNPEEEAQPQANLEELLETVNPGLAEEKS